MIFGEGRFYDLLFIPEISIPRNPRPSGLGTESSLAGLSFHLLCAEATRHVPSACWSISTLSTWEDWGRDWRKPSAGSGVKQGSLGTCGQEGVASWASRCLEHLAKASIAETGGSREMPGPRDCPPPRGPQKGSAQGPRARSGSEVKCHPELGNCILTLFHGFCLVDST